MKNLTSRLLLKYRRWVNGKSNKTLAIIFAVAVFTLGGSLSTLGADADGYGGSLPAEAVDREWRFRVFVDDKEIGYHDFRLQDDGVTRRLHSVADFEYKLLFVKLYEYQHENEEVWDGDCLDRIDSNTDANGKPFAVQGRRQDGAFIVRGIKGESTLPACVMSFAYWNPEFLKQRRLLNTQNGEFLEVTVSAPVYHEVEIRGKALPAWRYDLAAGPLKLQLWYSEENQWLGLASETESGRMLRYEAL